MQYSHNSHTQFCNLPWGTRNHIVLYLGFSILGSQLSISLACLWIACRVVFYCLISNSITNKAFHPRLPQITYSVCYEPFGGFFNAWGYILDPTFETEVNLIDSSLKIIVLNVKDMAKIWRSCLLCVRPQRHSSAPKNFNDLIVI